MLQKHILEVKKQNIANHSESEELEQYGQSQCLRFKGVPMEKNETSDKVLIKVMDLCTEVDANVPDTVIDRAGRIGIANVSNKRKKCCKSIILRFATFGHRIMVYRTKKNMKDNVRVKSDLAKNNALT